MAFHSYIFYPAILIRTVLFSAYKITALPITLNVNRVRRRHSATRESLFPERRNPWKVDAITIIIPTILPICFWLRGRHE